MLVGRICTRDKIVFHVVISSHPPPFRNCCGRKYLAILCPFCQIENWREFYKAQPVCDSIHHSGQFWVILKYQTLITFKWSKANENCELKEILCRGKRLITSCDASTLPKLPLMSWKHDAKHISVTMCFVPWQKKHRTIMCFDALRVCVMCHSDGKHHVICVSRKHKVGCVSSTHKIVISLTAYASAVTVDNGCINCLWKKKTKNHIKSFKCFTNKQKYVQIKL